MEQSSTDIGLEASILVWLYITEVEWKLASIHQATKIYNEGNRMKAIWVLYGYTKLSAEQRLSQEGDDRTGIATPTAFNYRTGQSTVRYIQQLRRLAVANTAGDESTSGLRERR